LTGEWIKAEEATDPGYWARHMREAVMFGKGISRLMEQKEVILLEVGPGRTLSTFARQNPGGTGRTILCSMKHAQETQSDQYFILNTLGRLWLAGAEVDWNGFNRHETRNRVILPTYSFDRQRYWIEPSRKAGKYTETYSNSTDEENSGIPEKSSVSEHNRPELSSEYIAPRNEIEKEMAHMLSNLLGISEVGVYDNFFELGGDSLLGTQFVQRLKQKFHGDFSLRQLFESPCIADLSQKADEGEGGKGNTVKLSARYKENNYAAPLSYSQQRLWFLDKMEKGNLAYSIPTAVRIKGDLNLQVLEKCFEEVIRRHDILRARFKDENGQAVQNISNAINFKLEISDLRNIPEEQKQHKFNQLVQEDIQKPFDIERDSLIRVIVAVLGEKEFSLIMSMHHIISDAWSIGVILHEIETMYECFSQNKLSPLPALPIQYTDYAVWQKELFEKDIFREEIEYWKQKLSGAKTVLELQTDYPRPPVQTYHGDRKYITLPSEICQPLRELSLQKGVSLYMTLLSAFTILLYRYTRQDDILVGSPIANRDQVETEGLIGLFVNTLVMRTDLTGNPNFLELLERVKETALEAFSNKNLPFEKLVEEVQTDRNLSYSPLFQVMFALQNTPIPELKLSDFDVHLLEIGCVAAKCDIEVNLWDDESGIHGWFDYNIDLFDSSTIERMIGHYIKLLGSIVGNPTQNISKFQYITDTELQQVVTEWNNTAKQYRQDKCLHQLFEEQAECYPDRTAVVFGNDSLTYKEFNYRANQVANYLRKCDVGPDKLVGVCMERSLEMVIALYSIMKAGGAYVPLDPGYPKGRLQYMLENSSVDIILTQEKFSELLKDYNARLIYLDNSWSEFEQEDGNNPVCLTNMDSLAYTIYTSGSTGNPKGVMNTHKGICNRLLWMQDAYKLNEHDRVIQKTPFSFDVSVWEFFWPLITGACLVVARPEGHKDSKYLARLIQEQNITTIHFVPSMLSVFLDEPEVEGCTSLIRVICSGEALTYNLQERFFKILGSELHNLYGPTEAAVDVTYWKCTPSYSRKIVPIGRPISNIQLYIADSELSPVPVGIPGELLIGGVGLARGYHNKPDLTGEKFIANPFSSIPGDRVYRTGDLVRYLPDGNIEYIGRIDYQVKIRGLRIELGEIETVLLEHPMVKEAVVAVQEDKNQQKYLVAYIVAQGHTFAKDELRSYVQKKVPEYMVPGYFVQMDNLPLSPNGKLDRKVLPSVESIRSERIEDYVAPRTEVEKIIVDIWREILGLDQVGVNDNFFEIGGHSLLMTRALSKLEAAFGKEISLVDLFKHSTPGSLALYLTQESTDEPSFDHLQDRIQKKKDAMRKVRKGRMGER
ncbi:MAG TPA: amino acid adenylation domain-containing protein, partial [Ruminiclostridium sp.]|nr:amino acid adenylation domain-containing protein [Ruminiclostridium sp.]